MLVFGNDLLYQNGVSLFQSGNKKRKWFNNPFLCLTLLSIVLVRDLSSLLVDNETYSTIVGDFSFKLKFKKEFKYVFISCTALCVGSYLCHMWYRYRKKENYLICFDSKLHLTDAINWKWKLFAKIFLLKNRVFCALMFGCISFGLLYLNLSLIDFLIFGIFWSILTTFCGYSCYINIWYIQIFYFIFVSKYFTNKFRIINYRLIGLAFIRNRRNLNSELSSLLKQIDATHRSLQDSDQFWSKYLLFNWIAIWTGLHNEANKTYYYLNSIFAKMDKDLDLFHKFKVSSIN